MMELFIKRNILQDLRQDLEKKEIAFLIGPRQSGKTTLMKVLQEELEKKGERTLFLSLDFEYDREYFLSQQSLIRKIELEFGREKGFVFYRRNSEKENAGLFLKGIHDLGLPYKFIVSGSGSVDLKAKIKESMVAGKEFMSSIRYHLLNLFILKPIIDMRTTFLIFSLPKSQNSISFYLNTSILEVTQG